MSHFRRAGGGRRDANEPLIMKRFAARGWHCTQLSGTAIPDLLCFPPAHRTGWLVDVKMPGKRATEAQVNEWTSLSEKGIPVYVASTEADVDAIVGGTATPWGPEVRGSIRAPKPHGDEKRERKRTIAADSALIFRKAAKVSAGFIPPRSTPVDASALAVETFAPDAVPPCGHCGEEYDPKCYHRDAPPGSVSCRKDVHCIKHDGHLYNCQAISPRACTT